MLFDSKPDDVRDYINAWTKFYMVKAGRDLSSRFSDAYIPEAYAALHTHIYNNLSILDTKASVLVSSASIFTAALGVILTNSDQQHWDRWLVAALSITTIASLFSVILVVSVVFVQWSSPSQLKEPDLDSLVRHVVEIRNSRTKRYVWGWVLHILVIFASFAMILLKLVSL